MREASREARRLEVRWVGRGWVCLVAWVFEVKVRGRKPVAPSWEKRNRVVGLGRSAASCENARRETRDEGGGAHWASREGRTGNGNGEEGEGGSTLERKEEEKRRDHTSSLLLVYPPRQCSVLTHLMPTAPHLFGPFTPHSPPRLFLLRGRAPRGPARGLPL